MMMLKLLKINQQKITIGKTFDRKAFHTILLQSQTNFQWISMMRSCISADSPKSIPDSTSTESNKLSMHVDDAILLKRGFTKK